MVNINRENCTGCRACANICPRKAIEMKRDIKGFYYPIINKDACVDCGLCEKTCHLETVVDLKPSVQTFLFVNDSIAVRKKSSSGGAFSVFAQEFVAAGGYVFGAEFTKEFLVQHNVYNDVEQVQRFQTSKYIQSDVSDSYKRVYELLMAGEKVLFSGTPCQISALNAYLKQKKCNAENLLTLDFICHGVGSPSFWKNCLDYYSSNGRKEIVDVSFRGKLRAGKLQNLLIKYSDGKVFFAPSTNLELFNYHFQKNYILRDSCYNCKYSSVDRVSDVTIGDCFKSTEETRKLNDGFGISFIMINSNKASIFINKLTASGTLVEVEKSNYIQPNMSKSTPKPVKYNEFWAAYEKKGFGEAIRVSDYANFKNSVKKIIATVVFALKLEPFIKMIKSALK